MEPGLAVSLAKEAAVASQPVNIDGVLAFSSRPLSPEWIVAFDEIGCMERLLTWGPSPHRNEFASCLRDAFVKDVSRRGLARILGRFARSLLDEMDGDTLQIPLSVLKALTWTDFPYQQNLVFLRLVNADTSSEDAVGIANEIAAFSRDHEHLVGDCLGVARRRLRLPVAERLARELCRTLPTSWWGARSVAFETVHDLLRQRHSTLADDTTREKLKLPSPVT
jgi:hypothetical protein